MSLWPTRKQWRSWTLPSKLTAIGTLLGTPSSIIISIIGIIICYHLFNIGPSKTNQKKLLAKVMDIKEDTSRIRQQIDVNDTQIQKDKHITSPSNEDSGLIPSIWRDPTLGIVFVRVGDDNYWIAKDEITFDQFKQYFSDTGFSDVDQDQSPGCVSIGRPESKKMMGDESITCVSLKEALNFVDWITEKDKRGIFSLPTKKEWLASCNRGAINTSTLEWCANKYYPNVPNDPTYWVVGRPSEQSALDCNYTNSGYALQRRDDVGFRLVWRPNQKQMRGGKE